MRRRTPAQQRISRSNARFNIACWGRQSGKTTFGLDKMVYKPLQGRKGGIYWNVLQTYSAAEVAFDRYCRLLYNSGLARRKPNESDLCFFLQNDANVFFKSGDKPQNMRSETLDGLILDECRQQRPETWKQILMPMLSRHKGWADFYSTPNGFDWFYDLYEMARIINPGGEWSTFHAPSTECWWWDEEQIQQAKASMSEAEFAQEILAEFRELHQGSAYMNYSSANERETSPFVDAESSGFIRRSFPLQSGSTSISRLWRGLSDKSVGMSTIGLMRSTYATRTLKRPPKSWRLRFSLTKDTEQTLQR